MADLKVRPLRGLAEARERHAESMARRFPVETEQTVADTEHGYLPTDPEPHGGEDPANPVLPRWFTDGLARWEQAEKIIRALISEPPAIRENNNGQTWCHHCGEEVHWFDPGDISSHAADCAWRMAREWAGEIDAAREAEKSAREAEK